MVLMLNIIHVQAQNNKAYRIPFFNNSSNTIEIDVKVNGLDQRFIFDTGASSISFGSEFYQLLKNNSSISDNDILNKTKVTIADGSLVDAKVINIKKVEIDDIILTNVIAVVIEKDNIPFLLGQSVFNSFGTFTIDNHNNEIIIRSISQNNNGVNLNNLKLIPCSFNSVLQVESINRRIKKYKPISISNIIEEKNVPPPPNVVNKIHNRIVIRFFDNNDRNKVSAIYDFLISEGYKDSDITIENMLRYYNNPIPNYIEVWVK